MRLYPISLKVVISTMVVLAMLSGCSANPVSKPVVDEQATPGATSLPTMPPPIATPKPTDVPPTATFSATFPPPTPTMTVTTIPTDTPTVVPSKTPTSLPTRQVGAALPAASNPKKGINVYLVQLKSGGTVGCGDSVVPVSTGLPRTKSIPADVEAALDYLLSMDEKYYGSLYNPTSYSPLRVQEVEFNNDVLTVRFSGKYHPSGDRCDNTRVKAQLWSTAKQFGGLSGTNFYINGIPFGDLLSNN